MEVDGQGNISVVDAAIIKTVVIKNYKFPYSPNNGNDITVTYTQGMTWADWVVSDDNIWKFEGSGDSDVIADGEFPLCGNDSGVLKANEFIEESYHYSLSWFG